MKSTKITFLVVLLASVFFSSCSYNEIVRKDESASSSWAQVQNAYQRRSDLVPNLVSTVKGYAAHEQGTFVSVTEARSKASEIKLDASQLTPEKLKEYQAAQAELGNAIGRLLMVREAYPELKANTNFMALQDELAGTENRIATARKTFNEQVQDYNSFIREFPRNIYAGWFGLEKKAYFEADAASQTAPKVTF